MSRTATIESLPQAFEVIKQMQDQGYDWGEDYRCAGRDALVDILEGRMVEAVDRHLERMSEGDQADRRNGVCRRWLLTELGRIELCVPRTRRFGSFKVVRAYARRAGHIDRMILACFVLGLSTRKVSKALLPELGVPVSASTVSRVAKTLDAAVAAFHRRPLKDIYPVLMLDGVVLKRKTGAGAIRRSVLVALGLRADGKKEIIDFRLAGDLDELLACFRYKDPKERKAVRTTNAMERRFREVRRRTRPMGVFADRTSIERILFAVFTHENQSQGVSTPFPLTQNS